MLYFHFYVSNNTFFHQRFHLFLFFVKYILSSGAWASFSIYRTSNRAGGNSTVTPEVPIVIQIAQNLIFASIVTMPFT